MNTVELLDNSTPEQQMAILSSWRAVFEAAQDIQGYFSAHIVAEALIYGDELTMQEDQVLFQLLNKRIARIEARISEAIAHRASSNE